jgi:hypothetical protein
VSNDGVERETEMEMEIAQSLPAIEILEKDSSLFKDLGSFLRKSHSKQ